MKVPAIAKKSFDQLKSHPVYMEIVKIVLQKLKNISSPLKRARFIHQMVSEFNEEVFTHPLVRQLSPCRGGCTHCCHSEVSITKDEALLLVNHIQEGGVEIDHASLEVQGDAGEKFMNLSYAQRKCVFLDETGLCKVYDDRPSVCRTNAVIGTPDQCDTSESIQPLRLILTQKADMTIYASFLFSEESGTLPQLVSRHLSKKKD